MKAIGYTRVSTEEQAAEGLSLGAQAERIRAYCKAAGLQLRELLADEGVSAADSFEKIAAEIAEFQLRSRHGAAGL
jgi:DNA invertase Pin-like site-specific DNA recombinase